MARIAVIGTGLIGTSIALGIKKAGTKAGVEVVGSDRFRDNARMAEQRRAVDRLEPNPAYAVQDAALVIIATPILAIREVMEQIAPALEPGAVVTDTGSTKSEIVRWAKELLPAHVEFVGGHPMAGKTESGPAAADADLFDGARWVICPPPRALPTSVDLVTGLARTLGAMPQFMDPGEHDAYVAAVSHLPMVAATALFQLTHDSEAWPEMSLLASTGFKDTTRLAGTEPAMAHDILITNREQITGWIQRYREALRTLEQQINDPQQENALFRTISELSLEYDAYRGGRVGRTEVHDNMLDELPDSGVMDLILGGALAERARELQKRSEERIAQTERDIRSAGRGS